MMIRTTLSILLNALIAIPFIYFNGWALQQGLEETFVALAVCYGLVSIVANAAFVALASVWPQRSRRTEPSPR